MAPAPTSRRPSRTKEDALADALSAANQGCYLYKMQEVARSFGVPPPQDITDERVLNGIAERAQSSAASIVSTQAERAAALLGQHDSVAEAQDAYDAWAAGQADLISHYEAAMTSSTALQDFIARNDQLRGMEWVEPTTSVGEDACADAISLGRQPLGTIDPPPYHPRCPHALVTSFDVPDDVGALWFAQAEE
jgi:hypothetical protein